MDSPIFKSRAMLDVEVKLEQALEEYFAEKYRTLTQEQIVEDLATRGVTISGATVSRWMRELRIATRFPGQRPPALEATA